MFDHSADHSLSQLLESVSAPLVCIECLRPWLVASERWRLKITDDAVPATVPYCPDCAQREFG